MTENWLALYIGIGIFAAFGIAAGCWAQPIKKAVGNLEKLASGHITDHHQYIPFD